MSSHTDECNKVRDELRDVAFSAARLSVATSGRTVSAWSHEYASYIVATNFLSHWIHWDYETSDAANGGAFAPVSRGAAAGCVPQSLHYVP